VKDVFAGADWTSLKNVSDMSASARAAITSWILSGDKSKIDRSRNDADG